MAGNRDFTQGSILKKLIVFMLPILCSLALQVFYGAVDLAIVGRFSSTEAVSGVSMGSQLISYATYMIAGMSTAITVLIGQHIGEKNAKAAGDIIGNGIVFLSCVTVFFMGLFCVFARPLLGLLNMPEEAMDEGAAYTVICGAGCIFTTAYNLLGAVFRGIGDSKTPLLTVGIACIFNIAGDLALVWGLNMGAAGAAIATIAAQALSVAISLVITLKRAKRGLIPFTFGKENLKLRKVMMLRIIKMAVPLAFNELVLGLSFLVLSAILNTLGVAASAAVGVTGKISAFIMIFTSAFMQALAAFVAQNYGAKNMKRARKAWLIGMVLACGLGLVMCGLLFLFGTFFAGIFTKDTEVMALAADFAKAYAVDTVFSAAMFCTCGYLNGCGMANISLVQCIIGAVVRVPAAFILMSAGGGSMFITGLCVPISTLAQLIFLLIYLGINNKKINNQFETAQE